MQLDLAFVIKSSEQLLELGPHPVPKFRLVRDVLRLPVTDPLYQSAQRALYQHRYVHELEETQLVDGTWGRFHTQDTKVKQRFVTTEAAITRALAIGLDRDHPLLRRAAGFIADHLTGKAAWSDPPEKHDTPWLWYYFTPLVSAANLALIDPAHPLLEVPHQQVTAMLGGAFASGAYRAEDEARAREEVYGFHSKSLGEFTLCKYGLILLAATGQPLPGDLEEKLFAHLLARPRGIYYTYEGRVGDTNSIPSGKMAAWLSAMELLARFPGWRKPTCEMIRWLAQQRSAAGLWDFGPVTALSGYFPLSDSYRRKQDRTIDWSVRVLALLRQYADEAAVIL